MTLGQKPIIVRQILDMDIEHVTIVTNAVTGARVAGVIDRAGLHRKYIIDFVEQTVPKDSPVEAMYEGVKKMGAMFRRPLILFADTLIDPKEIPDGMSSWVGVGEPDDFARHWTYWRDNKWHDDEPGTRAPVFIGAMQLDANTSTDYFSDDVAEFLNHMTICATHFKSWIDTGDVTSLADATRKTFINRPAHSLELNNLGVITKHGVDDAQVDYLLGLPKELKPLFPTVYDVKHNGHNNASVMMEYVELPSLAELWNYWPGRPDMWKAILGNVIDTMNEHVWSLKTTSRGVMHGRAYEMYIAKTQDRLKKVNLTEFEKAWTNDVLRRARPLCDNTIPGFIHGDLNFTNILYSLSAGTFRLLDPRGTWGAHSYIGDIRYEYAKLWYSYHAFSAITHGLFIDDGLIIIREAEINALDEVIGQYVDLEEMKLIGSLLLMSAVPLHDPSERNILMQCAEVMGITE